ncbi:helix-hairpin-helix domain-containing protein, partial [Janibacter sp. GXQ6167]|uniref:helix-hairpin-helix domain-containing protein n=1 Tax=Janibacter sp. GXQ6167 TaxID=3240791 RepID=UPI0035250431
QPPPPPTPPPASAKIVVHVVGQVRRPGVIELRAGTRVDDAIAAAGGATTKADLAQVNLARLAVDGEQIIVPKEGEAGTAAPAPQSPGASGVGPGGGGQLVDLNSADQATLETLPGVGPVLAQRIIEWRTDNGRFASVEDLNAVSGIGEKIFAQLAPKVRV